MSRGERSEPRTTPAIDTAIAGMAGPPNVARTHSANGGTATIAIPSVVPAPTDASAPYHVARFQKRPASIATAAPGRNAPTAFWM